MEEYRVNIGNAGHQKKLWFYSQMTIHAIFAVKYRESFITKNWRDNLHPYILGIITKQGAKSLAVEGWEGHVHNY